MSNVFGPSSANRKSAMATRLLSVNQFIRLLTLLGGFVVAIIATAMPLEGQGSALEVIDGRPLAKVVSELEARHGWRITYEDTFYEYQNELDDVTVIARRGNPPPGAPKVLVPRDRLFRFEYNAISNRPQEVLAALIKKYNSDSYSDGFGLVQQGPLYHVVPIRSLDAKGIVKDRQSRLDVAVSVDDRDRNLYETLEVILKEVSTAVGMPVLLGNVPMNLLRSQRARVSAQNERARDVLVRALGGTKTNLSWQLFCDPGALRICAFNLHLVPIPK